MAQSPSPTVSYPGSFAVSPPLSDIQGFGPAGKLKIHARRRSSHHAAEAHENHASDDALQTEGGSSLDSQEQPDFPGVGFSGSIPPDPNIAVGPNHVVQVVNVNIAVFDKNGNLHSGYPKSLSSLWSNLGGSCANNNAGDPIVQYDRLADRFIVTQLGSLSAPYSECIAVSTSGDPTGTYNLYFYSFGSNLNDYQKFSVWPTANGAGAYLATYNLFANGASFAGSDLCAYDRAAMLSGAAMPASVCFTISNDGGFLPSDLDGPTAPPDGTPGLFLNFETLSSLRMYKLSPNFGNPNSSTLSAATDIPVASFNQACGGGTCIPQPNTGQLLDSLGDRLMYRLAYRNFGNHESMVVNHSVAAGTSVGVRWYELRNTPPSAGATFSLYQQGTFAPDSAYRWMGSIAMDQAGDMALGYSESSSSLFPSINYTARKSTDPLGTMGSENILQSGGGSQTAYSRWGDYTAMRIDPSDDCTFWYTNEYYTATSFYAWSTAIGSFKLASCTGAATADFGISASASPLTFKAGTGGTSNGTVTVTSANGFNSTVNLTTGGACGTSSITCTLAPSVTPPANGSAGTSLVIGIGTGTPAGSYSITINGTSGALNHSTTLTVVVSAPAVDFGISASSITANRGSNGASTVSLSASGGSSSVSLSVSGLPQRTSASFSRNPATAPGSSKLTISVNWRARTGTYPLTITGKNSSSSHSTSVSLTIR
jgi:hypothetical protein